MYSFKGKYNGSTAYAVNDVVVQDGIAFTCVKACTNVKPPQRHHWQGFCESDAASFAADAQETVMDALTTAVAGITDGKKLYLASSTESSTKVFAITVVDDGTIAATEVVAGE